MDPNGNEDTDLEKKLIGAGGVPAARPKKQLPTWCYEFAAWFARQPVKPTKAEQIEWIQEYTQKGFTDYRLRKLHKNNEFQHALLTYTYNHLKRAEELVLRKLDKYVQRLDWAIDTAYEEGDYRTVGQLAPKPLENTIWKQKKEDKPSELNVTINLSEARLAGIDTEMPEVEVEEITDGEEEEDYSFT